jgi:hypothetical protein
MIVLQAATAPMGWVGLGLGNKAHVPLRRCYNLFLNAKNNFSTKACQSTRIDLLFHSWHKPSTEGHGAIDCDENCFGVHQKTPGGFRKFLFNPKFLRKLPLSVEDYRC